MDLQPNYLNLAEGLIRQNTSEQIRRAGRIFPGMVKIQDLAKATIEEFAQSIKQEQDRAPMNPSKLEQTVKEHLQGKKRQEAYSTHLVAAFILGMQQQSPDASREQLRLWPGMQERVEEKMQSEKPAPRVALVLGKKVENATDAFADLVKDERIGVKDLQTLVAQGVDRSDQSVADALIARVKSEITKQGSLDEAWTELLRHFDWERLGYDTKFQVTERSYRDIACDLKLIAAMGYCNGEQFRDSSRQLLIRLCADPDQATGEAAAVKEAWSTVVETFNYENGPLDKLPANSLELGIRHYREIIIALSQAYYAIQPDNQDVRDVPTALKEFVSSIRTPSPLVSKKQERDFPAIDQWLTDFYNALAAHDGILHNRQPQERDDLLQAALELFDKVSGEEVEVEYVPLTPEEEIAANKRLYDLWLVNKKISHRQHTDLIRGLEDKRVRAVPRTQSVAPSQAQQAKECEAREQRVRLRKRNTRAPKAQRGSKPGIAARLLGGTFKLVVGTFRVAATLVKALVRAALSPFRR